MNQREILFIVRMRNDARAALQALGGDLRNVAREGGRVAASNNAAAQSYTNIGTAARRALADVKALQAAMGRGMKIPQPSAGGGSGRGGGGLNPNNVNNLGKAFRANKKHADDFFGSIKEGVKHMVGFASAALVMEAGLEGVHKYFDIATEYQNLQGKLKLVTTSDQERNAVSEGIYNVATRSHQDIDSVGEAYYKGKSALGRFGYSDQQVLDLSQVINQANLISHASPTNSKYASYELMQGIGAGTLNGRELRSVQNDSIRLAQAISDGINKVRPDLAAKFGMAVTEGTMKGLKQIQPGQLRELTKDKLLTGTMLADALLSQKSVLDAQTQQIPLTLPRVMNDVHTSLVGTPGGPHAALGAFDERNGISSAVVNGLEGLSKIIPDLVQGLQPVASAIRDIATIGGGAFNTIMGAVQGLVTLMPGLVGLFQDLGTFVLSAGTAFTLLSIGMAAAQLAGEGFTAIMTSLNAAMDANPIGAVILAVSLLIGAYEMLKDKTVTLGGETASVGAIIASYWQSTITFVTTLWGDLWGTISGAIKAIRDDWNGMVNGMAGDFQPFVTWFQDTFGGIISWLGGEISKLFSLAGGVGAFVLSHIPGGNQLLSGITSTLADIGKRAGQAYKGAFHAAATDTKNGPKKFTVYDLTQKDQTIDPNSADENKKKPKKGPDLEKEAENDLKSLTAAYDPYLSNVDKAAEATDKLNQILKISHEAPAKFGDALKAAGLNMAQFQQLTYEVQHGLDSAGIKDFAKDYVVGFNDASEAERRKIESGKTLNNLLAAQAEALKKGGQAATDYKTALDHAGLTDAQVTQGAALQKLGVTADQLSPDKIQDWLKNYDASYDDAADSKRQSKLNPTGDALSKLINGGYDLKTIPSLKGVDLSHITTAIANQDAGNTAKDVTDGVKSTQTLMKDFAPALDGQSDQAAKMKDVADAMKLEAEGGTQFQQVLTMLGISLPQFNATITAAKNSLDSGNFFSQAAAAAQTFVDNVSKGAGMTFGKAWTDEFKSMEDALTQFIQTGKFNFKSLVDSMLSDLARMEAQKLMAGMFGLAGISPTSAAGTPGMAATGGGLLGWLGMGGGANTAAAATPAITNAGMMDAFNSTAPLNLGDGGGNAQGSNVPQGSNPLSGIVGLAAPLMKFLGFHSGGMVGGGSGWSSMLSPSVFAGAARFHTGGVIGDDGQALKSGEQPIIAKQKEAVFPTTRMSDGNFGIRAIMPNGMTGGSGQNIHFTPQLNITVQGTDQNSGSDHAQAISRSLMPVLQQMVQEQIINQTRAGGALFQGG